MQTTPQAMEEEREPVPALGPKTADHVLHLRQRYVGAL